MNYSGKKQLGNLGERITISYLEQQGFTILACNYQQFFGEIDIVAQKKSLIAFVEVKTRKNNTISMHELVAPSKQQKIIKTARHFISQQQSTQDAVYRFDVALVHAQDTAQTITYIPNAFCSSPD